MGAQPMNLGLIIASLIGAWLIFLGWWPLSANYFLLDPVLFAVAAIFCVFLLMGPGFKVNVQHRSLLVYLAFAFWVVLADAASGEFLPALARDTHWLILPLLVVLYTSLFEKYGDALKILQATAALSLMLIAYRLLDGADGVYDWARPPIFGNIRRLAMTVGVMSVLLYADAGYQRAEKILLIVGRVIGLTLLFWSGSRGAMLAWLLAFLTFVYLTKPQGRWRVWLIEIAAAMALAMLLDVGNPAMGLLNVVLRSIGVDISLKGVDKLSSSRLSLWMSAIDRLRQPDIALLGAGGNGFVRLGLAFGQVFHPHNIVLQAVTDWGVIGTGLLFWVAMRGLSGAVADWRGDSGVASAQGIALMVFLLIVGLLDGGLYHAQYLLFAAIAFALVAQHGQRMTIAGQDQAKRIEVSRITVMVLLVGAVCVHWLVRDYRAGWSVLPLNRPEAVLLRH